MDAEERLAVAFADTPRPPDDALLHPQCFDDNDIAALYGFGHWRDVTDEVVEGQYAAADFTRSKFVTLTPAEREAIVACLEAIETRGGEYEGAAASRALVHWRT